MICLFNSYFGLIFVNKFFKKTVSWLFRNLNIKFMLKSQILLMAYGTEILWAFFIVLLGASYYVGVRLQKIYKERGK